MRRIVMVVIAGVVLGGFGLGAGADERSPGKVSVPFNGKDLNGWKLRGDAKRSQWSAGLTEMDAANPGQLVLLPVSRKTAEPLVMINLKTGVDIYTEEKYGDCTIDLELMVPKGSNSGIYVMGEYEVQILDSWGREKVGTGDMGGLYASAAPRVNACKKPGEWQRFVIDFQAPRFDGGKKVSNAKFVKVVLNDQVIHENVEMKGPTPSCLTNKESPTGPILFQGDHGPVAFRKIRVTSK